MLELAKEGAIFLCKLRPVIRWKIYRIFFSTPKAGFFNLEDYMKTKACSGYGVIKNLTDFHKNTARKDGFQYCCKICRQLYDQNIKIKFNELHSVWLNLKNRCNSKTHPEYKYWGGRGITVCKEWQKFLPFYNWAITHGVKKGLQIDRRNNDGNYTPGNCRFVTCAENSRNSRATKLTVEKAKEIRKELSNGVLQKTLAQKYSVSSAQISMIKTGQHWIGV